MARADSIAEIARSSRSGERPFDIAVREFLDTWQGLSPAGRSAALADEPQPAGRIQDAYLAALAEHLALSEQMNIPDWVQGGGRFLSEPFFAGGLESLKATLLVESPLAFRRRLIFISANALTRPQREYAVP